MVLFCVTGYVVRGTGCWSGGVVNSARAGGAWWMYERVQRVVAKHVSGGALCSCFWGWCRGCFWGGEVLTFRSCACEGSLGTGGCTLVVVSRHVLSILRCSWVLVTAYCTPLGDVPSPITHSRSFPPSRHSWVPLLGTGCGCIVLVLARVLVRYMGFCVTGYGVRGTECWSWSMGTGATGGCGSFAQQFGSHWCCAAVWGVDWWCGVVQQVSERAGAKGREHSGEGSGACFLHG